MEEDGARAHHRPGRSTRRNITLSLARAARAPAFWTAICLSKAPDFMSSLETEMGMSIAATSVRSFNEVWVLWARISLMTWPRKPLVLTPQGQSQLIPRTRARTSPGSFCISYFNLNKYIYFFTHREMDLKLIEDRKKWLCSRCSVLLTWSSGHILGPLT